ncbi:MAG: hypothetical protein CMA12_02895 [Euryarchaeota archaeon]|nr:hypothetical protein [Euryarchaeota archaeon]OUW22639.1 MAG: hypothetical protein CBD33_01465 [Euryarchaeota archaeon TMED173]|tara:strand:+ start:226 stop:1209 length:984 start_codon:yes stop_codon:yes gene_type:complete
MVKRDTEISDSLQHPRRSLGNRYRSQAEKFLKLHQENDTNLPWAEQNARQSVLYDFTNDENWRVLIKIKVLMKDTEGALAVLGDLFSVLGRESDLVMQLSGQEIIDSCQGLLEAALTEDPLDADQWWNKTMKAEGGIQEFAKRLRSLDISDQRANILFSRRIERLRDAGLEDDFLELSRVILANRPNNHEAWEQLGRLYERREEFDEAWLCYDQAQSVSPSNSSRERFKERMVSLFEGKGPSPWKKPNVSDRSIFLDRLRDLTKTQDEIFHEGTEVLDSEESDFTRIDDLRHQGKVSEAFFLARRLAAEGKEGSQELVDELLGELDG